MAIVAEPDVVNVQVDPITGVIGWKVSSTRTQTTLLEAVRLATAQSDGALAQFAGAAVPVG